MLYAEYCVPNFLSKCQYIWGEDNMLSICQGGGRGGHFPYKGIYGRDARMD